MKTKLLKISIATVLIALGCNKKTIDASAPSENYPDTHTRPTDERPVGNNAGNSPSRPLGDLSNHLREEIARDKYITTDPKVIDISQQGKIVTLKGKVASYPESLRIATIAAKVAPELLVKNDLTYPSPTQAPKQVQNPKSNAK